MAPKKTSPPAGFGLMTSFFTKQATPAAAPKPAVTPVVVSSIDQKKDNVFSSGSTDTTDTPAVVIKSFALKEDDSVSRLTSHSHSNTPENKRVIVETLGPENVDCQNLKIP